MIEMSMSEMAAAVNGTLHGQDASFRGVSIDTRDLDPGALFAAFQGESVDGHDYASQAIAVGAAGVLAERELEARPTVVVENTERALGQLARAWRDRFSVRLIGVTGSNGKTTVKTMIHAILSQRYRTLVNEGNYNNELGLPLTLFGLNGQHQRVVLEMGAGKPGDIHYLMQIARPRVGVLNNASAAHLERMGSVEEVARTKGAIVSELPPDGTAIFNADDDYASMWSQMAGGRRQWTFGLVRPAAFTCTHRQVDGGRELKISGPDGFSCETLLRVPGLHNVSNALAATAAAVAAGADEAMVAAALSEFRVVAGRQQMMAHASGACLIKDTYNANPASLAAGIATLVDMSGEPWLILGDMGELGENEAGLHFDAGRQARRAGVSRLYAVGRLTAHTVAGFGPGAHHFDDKRALAEAVRAELRSGIVCLVKGSRAARMEEVVDMLMEERS